MTQSIDWPAWIQAVGSIVAILAGAFFVWFQQHLEYRLRQRDRTIEAGGIALLLQLDLARVKAQVSSIKKYLDHAIEFQSRCDLAEIRRDIDALEISIPPRLAATADRIHVLGAPAAATFGQLISFIQQYDRVVSEIRGRIELAEESEVKTDFGNSLQLARQLYEGIETLVPIVIEVNSSLSAKMFKPP